MLLQQLIHQPIASSKLVVFDPFRMPEPTELVKEVIGLANADVEGPRHILFGINAGAVDGSKIVGIEDDAAAALKKAHRTISALVEPVVSLAFIFDRFNGKLAGALEIDGGEDGPFMPGEGCAPDDTGKKTWIRVGHELRIIDISELGAANDDVSTEEPEEESGPVAIEIPPIDVGFNDRPGCAEIQLSIPDTSDPPFADADGGPGESTGEVRGPWKNEDDSSTDVVRAAEGLITDAQNHYYYEEKALHLNFSVLNTGSHPVDEVDIKLGFPKIDDFDIADRIHMSPFDKSSYPETRNKGYPKVKQIDRGIIVRNKIGTLRPSVPTPALECPIRMAVGPGAQMRKVAVLYTLKRAGEVIAEGRLKIKFGRVEDAS